VADPKPEDFMLQPADETDDVKFLPPARQGNKVEPLIDGAQFFPAIEEAIADAKESVYCTFWSIYPDTPLLSKKLLAAKFKDWRDLVVNTVKESSVKVRILLSDFDPRNDNDRHRKKAWYAFNLFVAAAVNAGLTKDQFQIMVSLHPASISGLIAASVTRKQFAKAIDNFNKDKKAKLENSPGIWADIEFAHKKIKMGAKPTLDAWPATYHQKTIIVDNKIGFLGGANISDYFQDDSTHLKPAEPTHDIFCRLEGPVVGDLERNFVGRWNAETAAFNTFIANANAAGKVLGKYKINAPFTIAALTLSNTTHGKQGNAVAQIHRTISSAVSVGVLGSSVTTVRDDIAKAYERAISLAKEFVYIENQVMRLNDLATWLINAVTANKNLQVILVLPVVPEEIADGTADPISKHGQALQHDALVRLKTALGANLGLYSLLQKKKAAKGLKFFDSLQIDVHCKIMVVDDVFAIIGSANTSERSFKLDSEINVGWYEAETAKKFREDLWKEHLDSPSGSLFSAWSSADYVKEWDAIANKNVKVKPHLRQGTVVPHDPEKEKGEKKPGLPDFLAEAGPLDQSDTAATRIA
jgi:phospholipase D1/2